MTMAMGPIEAVNFTEIVIIMIIIINSNYIASFKAVCIVLYILCTV